MAFELQDAFDPTAIGRIDHFLDDLDGTNPNRSLHFNLEILNQFGDTMKILSGNEVPHLTSTQQTQLLSFMSTRRSALPVDLGFAVGNILGRCTWRFRDFDGSLAGRSLFARAIELTAEGTFVQVHQFNDQVNLTQTQVNNALEFLDIQRAKAVAEILP